MPDEEIEKMLTAEHVDHDDFTEGKTTPEGGEGFSAVEAATGIVATSEGVTTTGVSVVGGAVGAGASSDGAAADGGDGGVPVQMPDPPHTGSGPFPDPPPK